MAHYCDANGKVKFPTRGAAVRAARRMKAQHRGTPSVYLCPHCCSWHLTHYSYRQCHNFSNERNTTKTRDMRIFIDTHDNQSTVMVDLFQPPEQQQKGILLALTKQPEPVAVGLTYDQALELVEALKIQIAKI